MIMPVAYQTFFSTHTATTYKTMAATTCIKSPLENENNMMKAKQQTMAGPRSPSARNNKMVATIAATANAK